MSSYFDNLQLDRLTLKNGTETRLDGDYLYPDAIDDHVNLVDYLKEMTEDELSFRRTELLVANQMRTEIGKRALYLARNSVNFDVWANCCEESEPRLIRALQPDAINNPLFKSPIILTHEGEPAGVIKRFGERTIYGLADHPDKDLYTSTFHGLKQHAKFIESLPPSDHAWEVPLDTPAIKYFAPLRISTFAAPLHERSALSHMDLGDQPDLSNDDMNAVQLYSHEMIYDLTKAAQQTAVKVSPL